MVEFSWPLLLLLLSKDVLRSVEGIGENGVKNSSSAFLERCVTHCPVKKWRSLGRVRAGICRICFHKVVNSTNIPVS